ncbi:MAG: dihydrofolate reductase family protein [Thermoanaerobaculia bacterium]
MRKLFWQMMVTLEGFMEGPNRELDWHVADEDFARYVAEMQASIDAILLGRVTYEMFAGYWPSPTEPEAPAMNELPKFVFSRTLERADWNDSRLVRGDVAEEVRRLRAQSGKDLALFGSANLASTFMRLGLIDEYRILVNPVVLGDGHPMFQGVRDGMSFELATSRTLRSGWPCFRIVRPDRRMP